MLELTSAGRPAHLSPGTSVQVEYHSPLFDEDTLKGQFSYSFNLPAGPNGPLYGWPERADRLQEPGEALPAELAYEGLPLLTGSQRVTGATAQKYTLSVQGGLSGANLSGRQLSSFSYGGLREVSRWLVTPDGNGDPIQVPGLVLHANEVVASPADYDYVFAPLRNEYLPPLPAGSPPYQAVSPLLYPDNTVNAWYVSEGNLFGMPAGGSFAYHVDFRVPGTSGAPFALLPPYCPFPRLRYVLQAICEECGLPVDAANLLPGELGDLVIVSNAQLVDRGDWNTLRFSLADVLPALTVAELLAALRQDLGIVVYVDAQTRRVRSARLSARVVPQVGDVDLTPYLAGTPELRVGSQPAGVTLTYGLDAADELSKDLLARQPAPSLVLPAVATVADLPATADLFADNPQPGQVRLVEASGRYYACTLGYRDAGSVYLNWTEQGPALPPVAVAGGGPEQAQALCYTAELPTSLNSTYPDLARVPAISPPPYRADQATVERSSALRLLFYNGLQEARPPFTGQATQGLRYPQLSHQSKSGALSVRLGGPQGTYQQLLQGWLPVRLRPASYQLALALSALELARLDLTRPVRVAGVPYLVRQLAATLPLRKPATLELVRL